MKASEAWYLGRIAGLPMGTSADPYDRYRLACDLADGYVAGMKVFVICDELVLLRAKQDRSGMYCFHQLQGISRMHSRRRVS